MKVGQVILVVVTILFVGVAIACHLIAFLTSYWLRSSSSAAANFLNIGLWVACFDGFTHREENPPVVYDGCHSLSSPVYRNIQDWLVPCEYNICAK